MDDVISFGRWLKLRRIALYLTQDDLARLVGCAAITIRKIEADERRPSAGTAERLARHLDLAPEDRGVFLRTARAELSALRLPPPIGGARAEAGTRAIPAPPTPLLGRAAEVALVRERLLRPDVRLVTISGPGGVGKTRVALQAAAELGAASPDGVRFVPLASVVDPALVAATLAQALGVKEAGARPLLERLRAHLAPRALLLVLDNFEHLLPAAPLVAELLAGAPRLTVLATSRAPLHLSGEHEIALPPLPQDDAVRLFVARSQAVRADFALVGEDAPAVAAICRRLDGLPLAIELAAAQVKLFTPRALLARLGDSGVAAHSALWLLTGGPADLPAHQQTLRSTIAWSYDLLHADEQRAFARLGVFAGGFTQEAASAVLHEGGGEAKPPHRMTLSAAAGPRTPIGSSEPAALGLLTSLLDKSLLRRAVGPGDEPRFEMLETIRAFALERLAASGEEEDARLRHAAFFLHEAEAADRLFHTDVGGVWAERLAADYDNLRAALAWAFEPPGVADAADTRDRREIGLRIAWGLSAFWFWRGHFTEGAMWFARAVEQRAGTSELAQAWVLCGAGLLARDQADLARMVALLQEALAIFRMLGDRDGCAEALLYLGLAALDRRDFARGEALLDEGLQVCRDVSAQKSALALLFLGESRYAQGDLPAADTLLTESLTILRGVGDRWLASVALHDLGRVALARGDSQRAEALVAAGLAQQRQAGMPWGIAGCLHTLGRIARRRGDTQHALELCRESLALLWDIGNTSQYAGCLETLAALAVDQRSTERAASILGGGAGLRAALGMPLSPVERDDHEHTWAAARAQLGEQAFTAAWERGRTMELADVIALALAAAVDRPMEVPA